MNRWGFALKACQSGGLLLLLILTGCVSARMNDHESDRLFRTQDYLAAAQRLERGYKEHGAQGKDALLFLLDIALSYHTLGDFEKSNRLFQLADKMAEIKDYTSLTNESVKFLIGENAGDYKGEEFESVLISTYLMMNYAVIGNFEDALVEARRVNRKLELMVTLGKRRYQQSAFARYVSGILFEAAGNDQDAYIDYKKAYRLSAQLSGLGQALWGAAGRLGLPDEQRDWGGIFHLSAREREHAQKRFQTEGEVIVLFENGLAPIKVEDPAFHQVPMFSPRFNPVQQAKVSVNGVVRAETKVADNIEALAVENLREKFGALIAKKVAGLAVKAGVAVAVGELTDSPLVGELTGLFLFWIDRADLRSWSLLPRDLQLARVSLPPGTYQVGLETGYGAPLPAKVVHVKAQQKVFVNFRFIP